MFIILHLYSILPCNPCLLSSFTVTDLILLDWLYGRLSLRVQFVVPKINSLLAFLYNVRHYNIGPD